MAKVKVLAFLVLLCLLLPMAGGGDKAANDAILKAAAEGVDAVAARAVVAPFIDQLGKDYDWYDNWIWNWAGKIDVMDLITYNDAMNSAWYNMVDAKWYLNESDKDFTAGGDWNKLANDRCGMGNHAGAKTAADNAYTSYWNSKTSRAVGGSTSNYAFDVNYQLNFICLMIVDKYTTGP